MTPFHHRPAVAALLSTCAANPPAETLVRDTYALTTDERVVYEGSVVSALRLMWHEAAARALAADDAGKVGAYDRFLSADPIRKPLKAKLVPPRFRLSHPVDRIVWVALQAGVVELEQAA